MYYDSPLQADHSECHGIDHPIEKYGVIDAQRWRKSDQFLAESRSWKICPM